MFQRLLLGQMRNRRRGRGRICTEEFVSAHGENGRPRFAIQGRGSVSGLGLLIRLRKPLELTIEKLGRSVERKLRLISLMKTMSIPFKLPVIFRMRFLNFSLSLGLISTLFLKIPGMENSATISTKSAARSPQRLRNNPALDRRIPILRRRD